MPKFSCSVLLPWLLAGVLLGSVPAVADELVKPYDFTPGAPASANQVNSNFDALYDRVNALQQTLDDLRLRLDALEVGHSVVVRFETSLGAFNVALDPARAPLTVENFLHYVDNGFFDGTIIHRVVPDFIIQGGGFNPGLQEKPPTAPPIVNEALNGLHNRRGTIAMARTSDIDSATSQFFVNVDDNRGLDPLINYTDESTLYGYAVFGRVIEGMATVDAIAGVATESVNLGQDVVLQNVPVTDVMLISVDRVAAP